MRWIGLSLFFLFLLGLVSAQDCQNGSYTFSLDGTSFTAYADDYQSLSHGAACTLEDFFFDVIANDYAYTISSPSAQITKFGDFGFAEGESVEVSLTFVFESDDPAASSSDKARLYISDVQGDTINPVTSYNIPVTEAGETAVVDLTYLPANDHGVFFGVGKEFGTSTGHFHASYSLVGGSLDPSLQNTPQSVQNLWQDGSLNPVTGTEYDQTQGLVEDIFDVDGDGIGGIFKGETEDGTEFYVITPKDDDGATYIIETDTGGNVGTFIKAVRDSPGAETAEVVYGVLVFGKIEQGNIVLASAQNKNSFQGKFPEFEVVTQEEVSAGGLFGLSQVFAQPFIWMGNLWKFLWGLLFGAT